MKVLASFALLVVTAGLIVMTLVFLAEEWRPAIAGVKTLE